MILSHCYAAVDDATHFCFLPQGTMILVSVGMAGAYAYIKKLTLLRMTFDQ